MGRRALIREATNLETPQERLWLLATDRDRAVRAAAIDNLALELDRRALLLRAHEGKPLASTELEWLSTLGVYGKEVAARNIATPDRILLRLAREGHLAAILKGRHIRDAAWFLEQAKTDHVLLRILSQESAVGWPVRRQAYNLMKFFPPPTLPAEEASSPISPGDSTQPNDEATTPDVPLTLRDRMLDRKTAYTLTPEEIKKVRVNAALRRLAARHPGTPARLLVWLDEQQPHGPARETLLHQLQFLPLHPNTLRHFALHRAWDLRAAVASNPKLSLPLVELLARDADTLVRSASAEHLELPPATLAFLSADSSVLVREAVAAHPSTDQEALARLAHDEEWEVQLNVARNPSTDMPTLALLALNKHAQVREAVAAHLMSDQTVLSLLAQDSNERVSQVARLRLPGLRQDERDAAASSKRRNVKLALVSQTDLSSDLLHRLSSDRSSAVRALAGLHPQLGYDARQRLRDDPDPQVRRVARAADANATPAELTALPRYDTRVKLALSRNGSTPAGVLDVLADDPQDVVRSMVVLHPSTPLTGLARRLPELELRPLLRKHPRYQGQLKQQMHEQELHEAAQADVSEETLRALQASDSVDVRGVLARHVRTPPDLLMSLTLDPDVQVRVALLEREQVPETLQLALVADTADEVRSALVRLPELGDEALLALVGQPSLGSALLRELAAHPNITSAGVDAFARHANLQSRQLAASHPLVSSVALNKLADDLQESVRQAVAVHPRCPPEALRLLARRPEHRQAVAQHPSTPTETLELLASDAGHARALRLPTTPKVLNMLREFLLHRASQQAFPHMALLLAIINHPHSSARAVRSASRLNHPEIAAAVRAWRNARNFQQDAHQHG